MNQHRYRFWCGFCVPPGVFSFGYMIIALNGKAVSSFPVSIQMAAALGTLVVWIGTVVAFIFGVMDDA